LERFEERFFLAAGRTFFPDKFRRFDCFARALTLVFRAAFFFFVFLPLRIGARRLLSAIRKMYHHIAQNDLGLRRIKQELRAFQVLKIVVPSRLPGE